MKLKRPSGGRPAIVLLVVVAVAMGVSVVVTGVFNLVTRLSSFFLK